MHLTGKTVFQLKMCFLAPGRKFLEASKTADFFPPWLALKSQIRVKPSDFFPSHQLFLGLLKQNWVPAMDAIEIYCFSLMYVARGTYGESHKFFIFQEASLTCKMPPTLYLLSYRKG